MEELYRKYYKIVYSFLYSLSHNKEITEDLTQETFIQAYISIERYNGQCKLSVWLCQISKHLWYRYIEKNKREISAGNSEDIVTYSKEAIENIPSKESQSSPEELYIIDEEKRELYKAIEALPDLSRQVVLLRITMDFSFYDIGQIMQKNENWARTTYFRAKQKLKRI